MADKDPPSLTPPEDHTLVVASRHREEERRSDPFITDSCKIKNGKLDEDSVHSILEYTAADGVVAQIYTRNITQQLALDLQRHNAQYRPIAIDVFQNAHDRFLCIDTQCITSAPR